MRKSFSEIQSHHECDLAISFLANLQIFSTFHEKMFSISFSVILSRNLYINAKVSLTDIMGWRSLSI